MLNQLANLTKEADFIAKELAAVNKEGWPWREMAVVYRARFIGEETTKRLRAASIPVQLLGEANGKRRFDPSEDSVKVMTTHSSKGLEFPVVAIPGVGYMPFRDQDARRGQASLSGNDPRNGVAADDVPSGNRIR